jgi:hypothetical protein
MFGGKAGMNWKEELDRERRRRGLPSPDSTAELDDTAEQHALRDRAIREAEPYVRQVRRDVFGESDPPWRPTQYREAAQWIRSRLESEAANGATGKRLELPLGPDTFRVPRGSSLYPLAEAVKRIANATGFPAVDVAGWLLSGEEPDLPRVRITVRDHAARLGARFLSRRSVSLDFNTPIREADFRRLFRQVRAAFEQGADFDFRASRGRKGPVLTPLDRHLAAIVERSPDATWEDRVLLWSQDPPPGKSAKEWRKSRHALVTADALRIRWARYQDKLKKIARMEAGHGEA